MPPTFESLPEGPVLIDVRSHAEYMSAHVPGAPGLPLPPLEQEVIHKLPPAPPRWSCTAPPAPAPSRPRA